MHGEGGQATVEWVALVLVAALVLGATAGFAERERNDGLGKAVAERISRTARATPGELVRKRAISARNRTSSEAALRGVRGVADVAKHAWIVCLGYERWKHELEHPSAPTEALPVDVALDIVNTCFNPHDYLLEEE